MKKYDKEVLKDAANRLFFDLNDEELESLKNEFGIVSKQMEFIGQIEGIDKAEPMTFPFDVTTDFLREDCPTTPLKKEDALKNAGSTKDGQIKLPKVVI